MTKLKHLTPAYGGSTKLTILSKSKDGILNLALSPLGRGFFVVLARLLSGRF